MMTPRKARCATCGVEWEHSGPGRPKFCQVHRSSRNRSRDLRRLERREGAAVAADVAAAIGASAGVADDAVLKSRTALAPAFFAVAYGLFPHDARRACAAVGLGDVTEAQIRSLIKEAEEHHRDLIEGRSSATAALLNRAVMLAGLYAITDAHALPVSQRPSAPKALAQAVDLLGFSSHAYATVRVIVGSAGPEDEGP